MLSKLSQNALADRNHPHPSLHQCLRNLSGVITITWRQITMQARRASRGALADCMNKRLAQTVFHLD